MQTQRHWVEAGNGIRLFAESWGNENNTPIILVHGYPDSHTVWQSIAGQLAEQFYVIAYDVRGAGKSSIPKHIKDYKIDVLARDLAAVADQIIPNRQFHLAAHDWGSIQSWESVTTPALEGRILSFTTLSGPSLDHAALMLRQQFKTNPAKVLKQLSMSWYIAGFHLPLLAPLSWKLFLGKKWHRVVDQLEKTEGLPENPTQTSDGVHGINLYRANFIDRLSHPRERIAHCPVQVIILEKDAFVSESYMKDLPRWVSDLTINRMKANHWAILSQPTTVANYIQDFALAYPA
ncbi:alpha/beta fold hydrolase [Alkanindiges sp. WGS2144]|uniref:alpha/beta fold hydrolase n=1 Tax=Alkanindiges sp. WGS2144 TaxID=3366808 RepID=UPI003751A4A9